eukprot:14814518-Heterocapsa_arctica.AAC.1
MPSNILPCHLAHTPALLVAPHSLATDEMLLSLPSSTASQVGQLSPRTPTAQVPTAEETSELAPPFVLDVDVHHSP